MLFRHVMMFLLWLTVVAVVAWSAYYANLHEPSLEAAGMIAAVSAPILALLGYAMNLFNKQESK